MKRWNFINGKGETIKTVVANTREAAAQKAEFLFGDKAVFLKIEEVRVGNNAKKN